MEEDPKPQLRLSEITDYAALNADEIFVRTKHGKGSRIVALSTLPLREFQKHCYRWHERNEIPHSVKKNQHG